jgi:predicted transporter
LVLVVTARHLLAITAQAEAILYSAPSLRLAADTAEKTQPTALQAVLVVAVAVALVLKVQAVQEIPRLFSHLKEAPEETDLARPVLLAAVVVARLLLAQMLETTVVMAALVLHRLFLAAVSLMLAVAVVEQDPHILLVLAVPVAVVLGLLRTLLLRHQVLLIPAAVAVEREQTTIRHSKVVPQVLAAPA